MSNQKFYKYKEKYLNLKKIQSGGNLCNLSDWTEISNNGQNNCGIFIHKTNPEILMKCGSTIIPYVNRINQHTHTFPIQHEECTIDGKKYLIMERFDNDITHIYFNLLPKIVLENMNLSKNTTEDMKMIFDIKTPSLNPIIPKDAQINILATISATNKEITLELYDMFINNLIKEWKVYHIIIMKEIIKKLLKLIDIGFEYGDMKFDNFGYKLLDDFLYSIHEIDPKYVQKLFGKYFYVYILDPESGLFPIVDENENLETFLRNNKNYGVTYEEIDKTIIELKNVKKYYIISDLYHEYISQKNKEPIMLKLLRFFNDGFDLSVHGQYSLSNMNEKIENSMSFYSDEVKKILNKQYRCEFDTYQITDIKELNDFIYKYPCEQCKNLLDIDSKYCYNCGLKII
jgi:hypothetical protein